jgi:hypothetical protein
LEIPEIVFNRSFKNSTVSQFDDPLEGKVFMVTRYVVGIDQHIYRITERVTQHGNYDLRERVVVATDASKFGALHLGEN